MSSNEPYTEYLPQVRCTATLKARLERIAVRSISRNLADHIRFAVERYIDAEEAALGLPPTPKPDPSLEELADGDAYHARLVAEQTGPEEGD